MLLSSWCCGERENLTCCQLLRWREMLGKRSQIKQNLVAHVMANNHIPIAKAVAVQEFSDINTVGPDPEEAVDEIGVRNFLMSHSWPNGLQDALVNTLKKMPIRFFICDDSGSMTYSGGMKLVNTNGKQSMIKCSRWEEMCQSMRFHAELAHYGSAPSVFRMLNRAQPVEIGFSRTQNSNAISPLDKFIHLMEESPQGGTPLCSHISAIIAQIRAREEALRQANQMACVIIDTDGQASDGNLVEVMRPLKNLPVWIVLRLCTDEQNVVEYWNDIDKQLELNMEVIDDFRGEAVEIKARNSWLTYGEPLHRMREFGVHIKELDFIDEKKCELAQIRILCAQIFGGRLDEYPHPEADWPGFKAVIERLNAGNPKVFTPVESGGPKHWVDLSRVQMGGSKCGCTIM